MASAIPGRRPRRPAEPRKPVVDPADWTKEDLARSDEWRYTLSAAETADLDRAVAAIERREIPLHEVRRADFALPVLGAALDAMREELADGRGFVVIRGVPVARYTRLQSAIAFWGIGTYFGEAVSQNAKGHLLGHVTNLSGDGDGEPTRGYLTANILPFHVDGLVDVVGLLCLQRAKSGGESAVASTIAIHNEMLRRRPDLVAALAEPIYRDRQGEIPPGARPYYALPVFNYWAGYLSTNFSNIRSAQRFPELPRHGPALVEALELFDELARELCFTMAFERGDVQLLNNHVIVHSRISAVEDDPDPARKRHLLRLRMMTPGGRPLPPGYFALENVPPEQLPSRRHSGAIVAPGTVLRIPLEPE